VHFIIRLLAARLVTPLPPTQPRRYRVAHFGSTAPLSSPLVAGLCVWTVHQDIRIVSLGAYVLIANRENKLSSDTGALEASGPHRSGPSPRLKNSTDPAVRKGDKVARK
jgi:hypothetical protein